ncbi:hypothetical protein BO83DRAFT_403826 [Aspergillus eucalypticola CBS 122712]|uniref:Transmembrane protein n=1 Tax=Aspergillus eucalypticola (strain CBS 122712 / IBT 29274) TaxID=1448314 RepID=A0A317UKM6_ASPEC|nr:uncharacterized protein BO83DRAFT_403826 [Aspergillus eucalypticola CBS 122712]PWY62553.1 hypothetical protein BO83DRAFT_403826 [Aspergillus eucalypticola CBS 122712]
MIGQAGAGSTGCQAGCAAKKARGERDTFIRVPPEDQRHPLGRFQTRLQQKHGVDKESPTDRSCESCVQLFFAESIAESTGSKYGVNRGLTPIHNALQRPIRGAERLDGVWLSPNAPARACRHAAYWCMCHRVVVMVNEKSILRSRRKEISRTADLPQLRTARGSERTSPTLAASTNEMATGEEGERGFRPAPLPKWSNSGQFRGSSRLCGLVPMPAEMDEQCVSYLRLALLNAVLTRSLLAAVEHALGASLPGLGAIGAYRLKSFSFSLLPLGNSVILGGGRVLMLCSRMTWTFFSPVYLIGCCCATTFYVSTRKKPKQKAKTRGGVQDLPPPLITPSATAF